MKVSAGIALAVAAILAGSVPAEASHPVDTDGEVPVLAVCDPGGTWLGQNVPTLLENGEGPYVFSVVLLNECKLAEIGAGPTDVLETIKHEMAHSRGAHHCEGTPETNPAYWPWLEWPSKEGRGC